MSLLDLDGCLKETYKEINYKHRILQCVKVKLEMDAAGKFVCTVFHQMDRAFFDRYNRRHRIDLVDLWSFSLIFYGLLTRINQS
jgi:hypothetical protein